MDQKARDDGFRSTHSFQPSLQHTTELPQLDFRRIFYQASTSPGHFDWQNTTLAVLCVSAQPKVFDSVGITRRSGILDYTLRRSEYECLLMFYQYSVKVFHLF